MQKNILDNINGIKLDDEQKACVYDNSKYLLVNAGAGSGKTLTILGKINYLIKVKNIKEKDILCISLTNETVNNLKNKLKDYNLDIMTFHKLALTIIKEYQSIELAPDYTLDDVIDYFFKYELPKNKKLSKYITNDINTKRLIKTFINLFKGQGLQKQEFIKYFKNNYNYQRHHLLKLVYIIYITYEEELKKQNMLDFNDLIVNATKLLNTTYNFKNYKYIIIDEYQDTSLVRLKLISKIVEHTNSNLMVVGDDFQSIYRFTGCDLNLFLSFTKYFKEAKVLSITNTYRNSQQLINVAGDFVMKNKHQMKKILKSNKDIEKPIKVVKGNVLNNLKILINKHNQEDILVLGRNNNDLDKLIDNEFKKVQEQYIYNNIKFKYLTAHKSKGLESTIVIIINLVDTQLGFPSQIKDHKLLKLVNNYNYPIEFDEERRLFYVALTRTKSIVYLLIDNNPSIFVKELIKNYKKDIETIKLSKY